MAKTNDLVVRTGERMRFAFNPQSGTVVLKAAPNCKVYYVANDDWKELVSNTPVTAPLAYEGLMSLESLTPGRHTIILAHVDETGATAETLTLEVFSVHLGLDVDADRDGIVGVNEPGKSNWVWGKGQRGAIALVNNDRDPSDIDLGNFRSEYSPLVVRDPGLAELPTEASIVLVATDPSSRRFRIFQAQGAGTPPVLVLGRNGDSSVSVSQPIPLHEGRFYFEALEFPNADFEGLISIDLELRHRNSVISSDRIVFRVAPWIMTPNTLMVSQVFACEIKQQDDYPNADFLKDLKATLEEIHIPLTVIPPDLNNNDRWIQDEVEFGYSESVSHILPVVFDSPRDRGLDGFPEASLLGPDFGHFQIGGSRTNSLDSFGNLEVSPPVSVAGRDYPFGRIIFGGRRYGNYDGLSRQMMTEVRRFLYAQKVQSPVEIYTDWLDVGHVDEIICFVPAPNPIGFQLLIASPLRAKSILQRLNDDGYGTTKLFAGRRRRDGASAEITVKKLLSTKQMWDANLEFQKHLDHNREILKKELGVTDKDVIEIPVLFYPPSSERTLAYFPDMVNHLVLGEWSLVPKPYGPVVNGECMFEKAFREAVPYRKVRFIEDWYSYHELSGEVHCGTNAVRSPAVGIHWWDSRPDGAYDV